MAAKVILDGLATIFPLEDLQFITLTYLGEVILFWFSLSLPTSHPKFKSFRAKVKNYLNSEDRNPNSKIIVEYTPFEFFRDKWSGMLVKQITSPGNIICPDIGVNEWVESLIVKANDVDTLAWFIDTLTHIGNHAVKRLWDHAAEWNRIEICRYVFNHCGPKLKSREKYLNHALGWFVHHLNFEAIAWCVNNGAKNVFKALPKNYIAGRLIRIIIIGRYYSHQIVQ